MINSPFLPGLPVTLLRALAATPPRPNGSPAVLRSKPLPRRRAERFEGQVTTCRACGGRKVVTKVLDVAESYPGLCEPDPEPHVVQCYPCGGSGFMVKVRGEQVPGHYEHNVL